MLGPVICIRTQMFSQIAKLLCKCHHEFRVAVDFVNKFCEHWDELFNTSLGAE